MFALFFLLVLQGQDDTIYKPIQAFPKGRAEIEFYRTVFDPDNCDPVLKALRNFVPQWRGLYFDPETKSELCLLENLHFRGNVCADCYLILICRMRSYQYVL